MRDTNLSSDASAGELCMLIFIDLAHLFMRQGHCLSTYYSTNTHSLISKGNSWRMPPKPQTSICQSTCSHLPPSRISHHHARPLAYQGVGCFFCCCWGDSLCLGGWTLFVNLVNSRHSHCRQPASTQRCRVCKLLCFHAALTILTQMRTDNWGCSLINNIKMEGVSWWLYGPL